MGKPESCAWCGDELDDGVGYAETNPNEYMCLDCQGTCDAQLALIKKLRSDVDALRAENERLKCCGNCVNRNNSCHPIPMGSADKCGEWTEFKEWRI